MIREVGNRAFESGDSLWDSLRESLRDSLRDSLGDLIKSNKMLKNKKKEIG
jgi:hypothetical protein